LFRQRVAGRARRRRQGRALAPHQSPTRTVEARRLGRSVAAGEEFFFRHFGKLNGKEKFHFDELRMIEGPLHQGNQKMRNIIEKQPRVLAAIPALAVSIWRSG